MSVFFSHILTQGGDTSKRSEITHYITIHYHLYYLLLLGHFYSDFRTMSQDTDIIIRHNIVQKLYR